MTSDAARYRGSFFTLLFEESEQGIEVKRLPEYGTGFYLLGGCVPIYLKHSIQRKGPWTFNFSRAHQESQQALYEIFGECFTCMVCGRDGVVGLSMDELRQVLDEKLEEQKAVSIRRRLKTMYRIKGRDGALDRRVSQKAVFEKLIEAVAGARQP